MSGKVKSRPDHIFSRSSPKPERRTVKNGTRRLRHTRIQKNSHYIQRIFSCHYVRPINSRGPATSRNRKTPDGGAACSAQGHWPAEACTLQSLPYPIRHRAYFSPCTRAILTGTAITPCQGPLLTSHIPNDIPSAVSTQPRQAGSGGGPTLRSCTQAEPQEPQAAARLSAPLSSRPTKRA